MNPRLAGVLVLLITGALAAGGPPGAAKAIGPEEAAKKVNEIVSRRRDSAGDSVGQAEA